MVVTLGVARSETEAVSLASSPRAKIEAALYEAALNAHPSWTKTTEVLGYPAWQCSDPKAPRTPAGLVEWFERNHPAETKRITASFN
jgi:hypothetical protein